MSKVPEIKGTYCKPPLILRFLDPPNFRVHLISRSCQK